MLTNKLVKSVRETPVAFASSNSNYPVFSLGLVYSLHHVNIVIL